jgi:hypothetical protein
MKLQNLSLVYALFLGISSVKSMNQKILITTRQSDKMVRCIDFNNKISQCYHINDLRDDVRKASSLGVKNESYDPSCVEYKGYNGKIFVFAVGKGDGITYKYLEDMVELPFSLANRDPSSLKIQHTDDKKLIIENISVQLRGIYQKKSVQEKASKSDDSNGQQTSYTKKNVSADPDKKTIRTIKKSSGGPLSFLKRPIVYVPLIGFVCFVAFKMLRK